eukprot:CAMPEP_0116902220 /NCGR_PEP_ID=MMETSP0467-20121206/9879_1 /TAXON_ID=283647 /ORGANISM="Mesodinium pulex, Strain SPMC105" /LENGTH=68 /DNA_ID=CAMNT_0004576003 /DNA_START=740 /DNA_END=946 /DNA_ORIENTATION=+
MSNSTNSIFPKKNAWLKTEVQNADHLNDFDDLNDLNDLNAHIDNKTSHSNNDMSKTEHTPKLLSIKTK